ncbi:MAG: ABC transporter ATP-binding protein [Candidatus Thiothrix putei]|uniref:ABC transporter ATP-binding protein n=1 Tax=Candidatus Thiothrix putei TaxID=3080811 RepID=A0AA95HDR4_9GAMM|nr:MAG: ABC transporter ATP-binding protein [Candidatus Thiothrix putei]
MSSEIAIKVEGVGKNYHIYDKPHHRLLQMFARGSKQYCRDFWAIKDVCFTVRKGETVGIIGRNGSGKSTLLQMICGTLTPTIGTITVNGRVAALLELGAGFNPEFTGRENVYMNATMLGLSREQIDARFAQIAAFADIGDFIEQPVKTYSSGMYVRLAFAVIAHVDADILVIDEALAVGDAFFTQKCMRFLRKFMQTGVVIFVSHDTSAVINLCSKAILLSDGTITKIGKPKEVTQDYLSMLYESSQNVDGIQTEENFKIDNKIYDQDEYNDMRTSLVNSSTLRNDIEVFNFDPDQAGFGTGDAKIISVRILDQNRVPFSWIVGGESVMLEIRCLARKEIFRPIIGFVFKDRLGQTIFADNTFLAYRDVPLFVNAGSEIIARFDFRLPILPPGDYSIDAALAEGTQDSHIQHHWTHDALIVRVHTSSICFGLVGVPMKKIVLEAH